MRIPLFLTFFGFTAAWAFSQPQKDSANASQDTTSAHQSYFADVNIFSQMPLGSMYILWSNFDNVSEDIKKKIMNHSFVIEPFYMQNIDREQFEQNQILHLFEEQKKAFFKLFPDDEDE